MIKSEPPRWLLQINDFADALSERAATRSEPFYRVECRDDIEYLRKAARLLKVLTAAYYGLSQQVNSFYAREQQLGAEAQEAIDIVEKQMKKLEI